MALSRRRVGGDLCARVGGGVCDFWGGGAALVACARAASARRAAPVGPTWPSVAVAPGGLPCWVGRTNAVAPSGERCPVARAAAQTPPPPAEWVERRGAFDAAFPVTDEVRGSGTCGAGLCRVHSDHAIHNIFGSVWLLILMPWFVGHPLRCVDTVAAAAARGGPHRGDRGRRPGAGGARQTSPPRHASRRARSARKRVRAAAAVAVLDPGPHATGGFIRPGPPEVADTPLTVPARRVSDPVGLKLWQAPLPGLLRARDVHDGADFPATLLHVCVGNVVPSRNWSL